MDCAAEESLVRMRLGELNGVKSLEFNLPAKQLVVYHEAAVQEVEAALASLELGVSHCGTETVEAATTNNISSDSLNVQASMMRLKWEMAIGKNHARAARLTLRQLSHWCSSELRNRGRDPKHQLPVTTV